MRNSDGSTAPSTVAGDARRELSAAGSAAQSDFVVGAGGEQQHLSDAITAHSTVFIGDVDEEDYPEILSRVRASRGREGRRRAGSEDNGASELAGGGTAIAGGDAPVPFHQRGTSGDSKAPQRVHGRPEIIHEEDGPPVPHSQIEADAGSGKKETSTGKRGVEIIDDEGPTPLPHQYDPQDGEGGSKKDEAMQNAYLLLRYVLWVLTGIPPPDEDAESGSAASPADEDRRPMGEEGGEEGSKEEDEAAPLPCWKRYERSACVVRALLLCVLAIGIAVGLTVNRQTVDSELEQVKQNPQSPTNPDARNVMACVCSLAQDNLDGSLFQLQGSHRCQDDDSLTYEQAQRAPSFSMCVYPSADDAAGGFWIEEVSMQHVESDTSWDANLTTSMGINESYLFVEDSGNATVKTMVLAPLSPITEIFSAISTPASFGGTLEVTGEVSFDVGQDAIPAPQTRQLTTAETATFQLSIDLLPDSTSNPGNGPSEAPSFQPVATDPTANPTFPFLLSNPPSNSPSSSPSADADPTAPVPCTNTIGFVDIWGLGCDYYEVNYPLFCDSYGANGPAGDTPNENCCYGWGN